MILHGTKDFYVRIYIDESVLTEQNFDSKKWIAILQGFSIFEKVQIICVKMPRYFDEKSKSHEGLLPVLFRYLTLFDPNVNIQLFRDIDNIWTTQHDYFVKEWLDRGDDICLFLNQNYKR